MNVLVDTHALSELKKREPHPGVVAWFAKIPAQALCLSVLTLGELRKGIEAMLDRERQERYLAWLEQELPRYFHGRILPIDSRIADRWGRLCAAAGRPLPAMDGLLAATALEHDLALVTRNRKDFALPGLRLIDPWNEAP